MFFVVSPAVSRSGAWCLPSHDTTIRGLPPGANRSPASLAWRSAWANASGCVSRSAHSRTSRRRSGDRTDVGNKSSACHAGKAANAPGINPRRSIRCKMRRSPRPCASLAQAMRPAWRRQTSLSRIATPRQC